MWTHPVTRSHLVTLSEWGYHIIQPIVKQLACGDVGIGAMETPKEIVSSLVNILTR